MKTFEIEYTTNEIDRKTELVKAQDYTKAYLQFVTEHPRKHEIIEVKEI